MAACIDVYAEVNASQSVGDALPSSSTTRVAGVALTTGIAGRTANKTSRTITMAGNFFPLHPLFMMTNTYYFPLKKSFEFSK
jgi:hypothetical protein